MAQLFFFFQCPGAVLTSTRLVSDLSPRFCFGFLEVNRCPRRPAPPFGALDLGSRIVQGPRGRGAGESGGAARGGAAEGGGLPQVPHPQLAGLAKFRWSQKRVGRSLFLFFQALVLLFVVFFRLFV